MSQSGIEITEIKVNTIKNKQPDSPLEAFVRVVLNGQFVILWALALHVENVRARRLTAVEHFLLSAVTILINPYLFVMVGFLQATTFAALWSIGALRIADACHRSDRLLPLRLLLVEPGHAADPAGVLLGYPPRRGS